MHDPIWRLVKIAKNPPRAKVFHSISTGYAGFLGALLHQQYKLPFILSEHGIYTKERWIDLLQQWWLQSTFKLQSGLGNPDYLVKTWVKFFEILARFCYGAANPIISLFEAYRQRQIRDGANPDRTIIIPNVVPSEQFIKLRKTKPNIDSPLLCFIGRVVPVKDIKTYIRAIAIAAKYLPHLQAWIVGSEEEDPEYVTECKDLVNLLGITHQIHFKGKQNIEEVLAQVDLIILSSISEGLPLVMLESFAAGIPVVATDVGACRELIYGNSDTDKALGLSGTIVNIADPQAIAMAAIELVQNPTEWAMKQKVAIERVKKFYNLENLIKSYSDIYQQALQ